MSMKQISMSVEELIKELSKYPPAAKAMIRYVCQEQEKDKLIEQMRSLIECEICKPCTSMRCDICNFKAAIEAAERGE